MKIRLLNGGCGERFNCKNAGKECCKPSPKLFRNYVDCDYFKTKQGGEKRMSKKEYTIKTTVSEVSRNKIRLEFGRTQGGLWITGTGLAARKLKLNVGDKILVTLKKG